MSETTVISLRECPKGWETNEQYAYIGRAGRGQTGYFGNPHPVGEHCDLCHDVHERGTAVEAFRTTFTNALYDPEYKRRIQELRGKTLVCFCHPRACHGDVIAEWLNATEPVMGFQGQYRWLSNFAGAEAANTKWPMRITYEGMVYPSTEHAYQAAKTVDPAERLQIAETARASSTKHLGRRLTLRSDWNEIRISVMLDLLFQKFSPTLNPTMAQLLWDSDGRDHPRCDGGHQLVVWVLVRLIAFVLILRLFYSAARDR
jgi:hypothetical protein